MRVTCESPCESLGSQKTHGQDLPAWELGSGWVGVVAGSDLLYPCNLTSSWDPKQVLYFATCASREVKNGTLYFC